LSYVSDGPGAGVVGSGAVALLLPVATLGASGAEILRHDLGHRSYHPASVANARPENDAGGALFPRRCRRRTSPLLPPGLLHDPGDDGSLSVFPRLCSLLATTACRAAPLPPAADRFPSRLGYSRGPGRSGGSPGTPPCRRLSRRGETAGGKPCLL